MSDSPDKPPPLPIASLTLIIEDDFARKLLAWWSFVKPSFEDAEERLEEIAALCGADESEIELTLNRCKVSGLVLDGEGITPVAVHWVYQGVGEKMGMVKKKAPKKAAAK